MLKVVLLVMVILKLKVKERFDAQHALFTTIQNVSLLCLCNVATFSNFLSLYCKFWHSIEYFCLKNDNVLIT